MFVDLGSQRLVAGDYQGRRLAQAPYFYLTSLISSDCLETSERSAIAAELRQRELQARRSHAATGTPAPSYGMGGAR